jgi:hypothetical protein
MRRGIEIPRRQRLFGVRNLPPYVVRGPAILARMADMLLTQYYNVTDQRRTTTLVGRWVR